MSITMTAVPPNHNIGEATSTSTCSEVGRWLLNATDEHSIPICPRRLK